MTTPTTAESTGSNPAPAATPAGQPGRTLPERLVTFQPRVDIYEGEDDWLLLADLPGVEPADVHVKTERDTLELAATGVGLDGTRIAFRRSFQLARGTAVDAIRAELKDGVLTLTLPKAAEVRSRAIEVKVG